MMHCIELHALNRTVKRHLRVLCISISGVFQRFASNCVFGYFYFNLPITIDWSCESINFKRLFKETFQVVCTEIKITRHLQREICALSSRKWRHDGSIGRACLRSTVVELRHGHTATCALQPSCVRSYFRWSRVAAGLQTGSRKLACGRTWTTLSSCRRWYAISRKPTAAAGNNRIRSRDPASRMRGAPT